MGKREGEGERGWSGQYNASHMSVGQQYTVQLAKYFLSTIPEIPPEALWCVKLQPAFDEVGKDRLELHQHLPLCILAVLTIGAGDR